LQLIKLKFLFLEHPRLSWAIAENITADIETKLYFSGLHPAALKLYSRRADGGIGPRSDMTCAYAPYPRKQTIGTVHRILEHANFTTAMKLCGGLTVEALDKATAHWAMRSSPSRK